MIVFVSTGYLEKIFLRRVKIPWNHGLRFAKWSSD
jgi:hypothetical protein